MRPKYRACFRLHLTSSFLTRPFLPFRPFFGTEQVPANDSFNTCRSFLRVPTLHISSRFPLSPFSSSNELLLLSCPARLSKRVAIGEEKETTHRAWQIGNEEIVDGWKRWPICARKDGNLERRVFEGSWNGLLGISSAIEGIIFKKILMERLQGKGEERNRYSAKLFDDKEIKGWTKGGQVRWHGQVNRSCSLRSSFSVISPLLTETTRRK